MGSAGEGRLMSGPLPRPFQAPLVLARPFKNGEWAAKNVGALARKRIGCATPEHPGGSIRARVRVIPPGGSGDAVHESKAGGPNGHRNQEQGLWCESAGR